MSRNHILQRFDSEVGYSLIPARRFKEYIARPALLNDLKAQLDERMVLLIAPSGYGKTALLSEAYCSLSNSGKEYLFWVSLREQGRYDNLLTTILDEIQIGEAIEFRDATVCIDNIDRLPSSELKDLLHVIHELFLRGLKFIFTAQKLTDDLAAFYTKGLIKIYGRKELAFTFEETREYLKTRCGEVSEGAVREIFDFAEGWAEGLYLLTEGYREFGKRGEFASSILIDRFFLQVIAALGFEDEFVFLVQTSLLGALDPELCNYLTEREDSAELLRSMELAGLYVSYDSGAMTEFCYDKPFREWLLSKLYKEYSESSIRHLNQRAARWHEDKGYPHMSAKHVLKASDVSFVEDLTGFSVSLGKERTGSFQSWVESINPHEMEKSSFICTLVAWAYVCLGRSKDAFIWAQRLLGEDDADTEPTFEAPISKTLLGYHCIRAKCLSLDGSFLEGIELLKKLIPFIKGPNNVAIQCLFEQTFAESYEQLAEPELALEHFTKAETLGEMGGYELVTALCRYSTATIHYTQGNLAQTEAICRRSLLDCPEDYSLYGGLLSMRARVEIAQNRLDEAEGTLSMVFSKLSEERNVDILIDANNVKASLLRARGKLKEAYKLSIKNAHIAESKQKVPRGALLATLIRQAYYSFDLGYYYKTEELLRRARQMVGSGDTESRVSMELLTARLHINAGDQDQAHELLSKTIQKAEKKKLVKKRVEALLLRASLYRTRGQLNQSVLDINAALKEGNKFQLIDVFLLAKAHTQIMICEMLSERKLNRETRQFAKALIAYMVAETKQSEEDKASRASLKRSRLTMREQEVLDLMNLGMTRKEIADELSISPNTAKVHIASIYSKLGVGNRLDAFHESLVVDA